MVSEVTPMPYKDPNSEAAKASAKRKHKKYIETHGGYREVTKDYTSRHPNALRNSWYKHAHGVTLEEFEAQIAVQNNRCPIGNHPFGERGKKNDSPCQDHNHETGENRAVLCRRHNIAIGYFNESVAELESAISYLKGYSKV
jgi:Recombination endonuclease VII